MQESGRAGRDGTKSDCYLYFSYRDKSKLQAMIMKGRDDGGQANSHQSMQMGIENLLSCVSFCLNDVDCRRQQLLGYFGEHFTSEQCNKTCDNCANQGLINTVDFTEHAKNILLLVKEIDSNRRSVARLTLIKAAKLYSGAKDKETSKYSANIPAVDDIVKRAASISKISRPMVERLLMEMIIKKYLDEEVEEGQSIHEIHFLNVNNLYENIITRQLQTAYRNNNFEIFEKEDYLAKFKKCGRGKDSQADIHYRMPGLPDFAAQMWLSYVATGVDEECDREVFEVTESQPHKEGMRYWL
jgi:superfamily II DNA helicase RecQ